MFHGMVMSETQSSYKQTVKIDYSKIAKFEPGESFTGVVAEIGDGVGRDVVYKNKDTKEDIIKPKIMIPLTVISKDGKFQVQATIWIGARKRETENGVVYEPVEQLNRKSTAYKILKRYGAKTIAELKGKEVTLTLTDKGYWRFSDIE